MGFTKVDWTSEADMKEGHGYNDEDACGPNSAGEPESDGCKGVQPGSIVGGTTKGFGDDFPNEDDESEHITSCNPEVGLVSWHQLLEIRKTKFSLCTSSATLPYQGEEWGGKTYRCHPPAQGMRGKDGDDNAKDDEY